MKKITFTIAALLLCSIGFVKAQAVDTIPNGDFERWTPTTSTGKEIPQGWDTLAGKAYPVTDVTYLKGDVFIDRPVIDGTYALSLASQALPNNSFRPGVIECKFAVKHRDPYLNMNLAYFEAVAPQSPEFGILLWNSTTNDTLIDGVVPLSNVATANDTIEPWGTFPIQMQYSTTDTTSPDSCLILISNFLNVQGAAPTPNTLLYIEKMWFDNTAAAGISSAATVSNGVGVYPNPFTEKTTIHYNLTQSGEVNLTVYDMQGKEIRTLVNDNQSAGTYSQVFDGSGLSNGVYFYKLQTSSGVKTGKLILSR